MICTCTLGWVVSLRTKVFSTLVDNLHDCLHKVFYTFVTLCDCLHKVFSTFVALYDFSQVFYTLVTLCDVSQVFSTFVTLCDVCIKFEGGEDAEEDANVLARSLFRLRAAPACNKGYLSHPPPTSQCDPMQDKRQN